jgi:hypothetical protein
VDTSVPASVESDASVDIPIRHARESMSEVKAPTKRLIAQGDVVDDRKSRVAISEARTAEQTLELQQQKGVVENKHSENTARLAGVEDRETTIEIHSRQLQNRENAARTLDSEALEKYGLVEARECATVYKEEANEKQLPSIQTGENDFMVAMNSSKEEIQVDNQLSNGYHGKRGLSIIDRN